MVRKDGGRFWTECMTNFNFKDNEQFALDLDTADPLRSYRDLFHIPKSTGGQEYIYLAGNSLGLQPREARSFIEQELQDWASLGVEGHFHAKTPWFPYHEFLTQPMAQIVGARPIEVVL